MNGSVRPPVAGDPATSRLTAPVLRSPFASQLNRHTDRAEQHALIWAERIGLVPAAALPELARQRFGLLAGRSHPDLGLAALTDVCRWYLWFAILDDQYCDGPQPDADAGWLAHQLVGITRTLEDPRARVSDPVAVAARDLARRTRHWATDEQYQRLVMSFHATFFGLMWERTARRLGAPVSTSDYVRMRRHSGALPAFLTLTEIYGGRPPAPHDLARPEVTDLVSRVGNLIMWQNDIRSYPVEVASGQPVLSLPTVLERERGLTSAEALRVSARMWQAEVEEYRRSRARVLELASCALARYADRLHLLLAGFLTWPYETVRYN
jgi:hypothetical protein